MLSVLEVLTSIAGIPNIFKTGLLSNAYAFLLLHNHPSGDVTPSQDDIQLTMRCREAGKILDIPCLDHIIVGGGNGSFLSLRESGMMRFDNERSAMTAEELLQVSENKARANSVKTRKGETAMAYEMKKDNVQVPDFVQEAEAMMANERNAQKQEEVTIKFGKGLAEPFTSKNGKMFMRIRIPNQDPSDKSPWASFVLPAGIVHENQYGKGLWAKIPAEGTMVITKPTLTGRDDTGKNIWKDIKTQVSNRELKGMVEAYKAKTPQMRESARKQVEGLVKDTAEKISAEKPRSRAKAREPSL